MMKFNWGTKLFIGAALFIVFIVSMVTFMIRQNIELVKDNYYEDALNYESELQKFKKTKGLDFEITYNDSAQQLLFHSAMGGRQSGFAYFYRPNQSNLDFVKSFVLNEYGTSILSTADLEKGRWKVKYEWVVNNDTLAAVKEFYIQ